MDRTMSAGINLPRSASTESLLDRKNVGLDSKTNSGTAPPLWSVRPGVTRALFGSDGDNDTAPELPRFNLTFLPGFSHGRLVKNGALATTKVSPSATTTVSLLDLVKAIENRANEPTLEPSMAMAALAHLSLRDDKLGHEARDVLERMQAHNARNPARQAAVVQERVVDEAIAGATGGSSANQFLRVSHEDGRPYDAPLRPGVKRGLAEIATDRAAMKALMLKKESLTTALDGLNRTRERLETRMNQAINRSVKGMVASLGFAGAAFFGWLAWPVGVVMGTVALGATIYMFVQSRKASRWRAELEAHQGQNQGTVQRLQREIAEINQSLGRISSNLQADALPEAPAVSPLSPHEASAIRRAYEGDTTRIGHGELTLRNEDLVVQGLDDSLDGTGALVQLSRRGANKRDASPTLEALKPPMTNPDEENPKMVGGYLQYTIKLPPRDSKAHSLPKHAGHDMPGNFEPRERRLQNGLNDRRDA